MPIRTIRIQANILPKFTVDAAPLTIDWDDVIDQVQGSFPKEKHVLEVEKQRKSTRTIHAPAQGAFELPPEASDSSDEEFEADEEELSSGESMSGDESVGGEHGADAQRSRLDSVLRNIESRDRKVYDRLMNVGSGEDGEGEIMDEDSDYERDSFIDDTEFTDLLKDQGHDIEPEDIQSLEKPKENEKQAETEKPKGTPKAKPKKPPAEPLPMKPMMMSFAIKEDGYSSELIAALKKLFDNCKSLYDKDPQKKHSSIPKDLKPDLAEVNYWREQNSEFRHGIPQRMMEDIERFPILCTYSTKTLRVKMNSVLEQLRLVRADEKLNQMTTQLKAMIGTEGGWSEEIAKLSTELLRGMRDTAVARDRKVNVESKVKELSEELGKLWPSESNQTERLQALIPELDKIQPPIYFPSRKGRKKKIKVKDSK